MLVHVSDALVFLQVPDLDVALRKGDENIGVGDRVDVGHLVVVALVHDAELPFVDVDQVDIHVFRAQEQVVFILAEFDALDILGEERTEVVLLDEHSVQPVPNTEVSILRARYDPVAATADVPSCPGASLLVLRGGVLDCFVIAFLLLFWVKGRY